jgi:molecular chaperone GrpE
MFLQNAICVMKQQNENHKLIQKILRKIWLRVPFPKSFFNHTFFQAIAKAMSHEELEPKEPIVNASESEAETIDVTAEEMPKNDAKSESAKSSSNEEKLKAEIADLKDKYLRLYSDFDNFRKRTAKEKIDLIQSANKDLFLALIPVVDDFERGKRFEVQAEKDIKVMEAGIELIYNKLVRILEHQGLKVMPNTIGQIFDMDFHEAITQIPAPSEDMKGKVVDEIEKGYLIGEKVVRFAKVVVGI